MKNSLTSLPIGGGKEGSDFDPKGKSDSEVMRFCQSFMTELLRHTGPDTDVLAGDIRVGGREIGYIFGQYKRLRDEFTGVLSGRGYNCRGSLIRPEATGYGLVYLIKEMLGTKGDSLSGKVVTISGSGNAALFAGEKATSFGAKVVTIFDSSWYVYNKELIYSEKLAFLISNFRIDSEKLAFLMDLQFVGQWGITEYASKYPSITFYKGEKPWKVKCKVASPSAQNELNGEDAKGVVSNGVVAVREGANMPSTPETIEHFLKKENIVPSRKRSKCRGSGS